MNLWWREWLIFLDILHVNKPEICIIGFCWVVSIWFCFLNKELVFFTNMASAWQICIFYLYHLPIILTDSPNILSWHLGPKEWCLAISNKILLPNITSKLTCSCMFLCVVHTYQQHTSRQFLILLSKKLQTNPREGWHVSILVLLLLRKLCFESFDVTLTTYVQSE